MSRIRWAWWSGLVLLVAGVLLGGWVAWQYWGTTWVSERRHAAVADELRRAWDAGTDTASVDDLGTATALVRVPALGEDWVVPLLDGTSDEVLASGLGRSEDGAEPGDEGNLVVSGHRVTHGEPFADLPDLEPGDEVLVETRTHTYVYRLDTGGDDLDLPFTASWVLAARPVNPDASGPGPETGAARLITLVTCADLFHSDRRLVVFGHLTGVRPRA
ncbi:class E sortase [Nocardioides lianchengensis]|uniref:class E sortase n=1 Tax=Nocardioides lianchengensis TaxID=1045774 RepID=UPI00147E52FC|nr:class E sortase [Nocardioides lianchengensis]NYG12627.1 sortase A [Nocardioides lianchengensis]